jgi:hypothetical protein
MKSWLLEVRHFPGKHTGIAIASELEKCIELWGLKKENCVKFVRDGAANGVKACNELQINHMSCLAHSLHLVVAAGLINKLKETNVDIQSNEIETIVLDDGDNEQNVVEEVESFVKENCGNIDSLNNMRDIVGKFRSIAKYFSKSPMAMSRLKILQSNTSPPLGIVVDCPTRWNSTLIMLKRMLRLRTVLDDFFRYAKSSDGLSELSDMKLRPPTSVQWFSIQCLVELLTLFEDATKILSGQQYLTLIMAFPILRAIKSCLSDESIFNETAASAISECFAESVLSSMHCVRNAFWSYLKNDLVIYRKKSCGFHFLIHDL